MSAPSMPPTETAEELAPAVGGRIAVEATPRFRPRGIVGYLFMPVVLGTALLALYLWIQGQELGSTEMRLINAENIRTSLLRHLQLTVISTLLVLLIAIPVGIILTRPLLGRVTQPAIAVFNIGQALPTIGILALFAIVWDIGFWPVITALVAYTVLPVLRNTMVGLQQVDPSVIESARGMGMTRRAVLVRIELPLAIPILMAGVRTALVINVATVTLATFVAGGGLGDIISGGFSTGRDTVIIVGAVLTAVTALTVDYLAGIAENVLRPKGL